MAQRGLADGRPDSRDHYAGNHTGRSVWEVAAMRRSLNALADIYLITPDNWKHGSGFVSGNKVVRLLTADVYFGFIASQIRL